MDKLKGVIVPLITPLTQNEEIDIPSLKKLLKHILDAGVNGVFALSTSGETARLCDEQKNVILETVMNVCHGKIDVYAGIMGSGLKMVMANLDKAVAFGAQAAVLCPPYCYHVSDKEMIKFFLEISQESPIPLMLYNIPSLTGTSIGNNVYETVKHTKNIIGVKDSSGDINYLRNLIIKHASSDFKVLVGSESIMLEGLKMGAIGLVPSLANVFPKLFVDFYNAFVNKDIHQTELIFKIVQEFNSIHSKEYYALEPIATRKQALSMLGIMQPWMTEPAVAEDIEYITAIEKYLSDYADLLGL